MNSYNANPVLVEVTRGDMVESFHRGAAAVADSEGREIASFGDIENPIYPRSAIKPLQAFVLAESGALEHYGLGAEHVALACASHSSEPRHTDGVREWLNRLGLDESVLECGSHYPAHRETRIAMTRNSVSATAVHNNCSGKHAGFISVACHRGEPVSGYINRDHPVQQRVLQVISELTGESVTAAPAGLDGCGIPVAGITLRGIARAFAAFAGGHFNSAKRREAADRICRSMAKHPELVGGTGRLCTEAPLATDGRVLIKVGAEGVYAGLAMGPNPIGFALKIDDGTRRAAEVAVCWLIKKFCHLQTAEIDRLRPWLQPEVRTVAKRPAGVIRPASGL